MTAAFRWVIARHLWTERARTGLSLLGVALGVGVFVSVRLASTSAMGSFEQTVDAVAGRANLTLEAGGEGLDERAFAVARGMPGVEAAAPVVQVEALARPGAPARGSAPRARDLYPDQVLVLGVDLFSEPAFERFRLWGPADSVTRAAGGAALEFLNDPRAVAITRTLATRHGLARGDSLTVLSSGVPVVLRVRAILESPGLQNAYGGNVVLVDLATAQDRFHRLGRLDRVDLVVDPARREGVERALRAALPGVAVETPRARSRQVENMVRSFRLNLTALSFIALFVASFLILDTVSMSVTRRRREIGVLRTLGMTRRRVAALFVGEGALLGAAGGALGLLLGALLARGTLAAVSRTLSDLYLVHQAQRLEPDAASYLVAFALGVVVATASALVPALEAAGVPPAGTVREDAAPPPARARLARWTLVGLAALAAAGLVAAWTVASHHAWGGFASAFLVLAAGAALAPGWTLVAHAALAPLARAALGVEGRLGAAFLRASVGRASVAVAAVMVSVGMWVALAIMVGSFRDTVDTWVGQTVRGDLYVEPAGHRLNAAATVLPAGLPEATHALPGVAAVDTYRGARIVYRDRPATAIGIDLAVQLAHGGLRFTRGASLPILERALARGEALVSESFARHHALAPGDTIALNARGGERRLRVAGVFYDYTTDAGVVMLDRALYARLWEDRVESMAVYLEPGANADLVRERIVELAGPALMLSVTPQRALRARVLEVFDQTFRITYALQAIAILVAVLGVIGTLTALVLQRRREIGILRATGALRRQVLKMVLVEGAAIGLAGAVLGCMAGVVLALILVGVINTQYFGWTIRLTISPGVLLSAVLVMTAAATVAGLSPARLAAGRPAAEGVREE